METSPAAPPNPRSSEGNYLRDAMDSAIQKQRKQFQNANFHKIKKALIFTAILSLFLSMLFLKAS